MSGEVNVSALLAALSTTLADDIYVFVTLPDGQVPSPLSPRMVYIEDEGTTLIITQEQAKKYALKYEFPCRMITLNVHSSLETVGFMAAIATELAKHDMGVNSVSGFFHDHLFVPEGREQDALHILSLLAEKHASRN